MTRVTALHLGLTGGIGSGKSTVARLLAQRGATIIDADAISKAVTAPHGSAITALEFAFGHTMLTADGALDRDKMRQRIYADPSAKALLESIVHPLVGSEITLQAAEAARSGCPCIVFDIPLLVESSHWRGKLDRVLVIDCTRETQIARVTARNGLSVADTEKILAAQASRLQRLQAADSVLFNDGITVTTLAQKVYEISPQFGL